MKKSKARKTIFQLVVEKYNISQELNKIKRLFDNEKYFYLAEGLALEYSLSELIETYLFKIWKYKDTCIDIKEYFERVVRSCLCEEEKYINFLEVMENFCKLYFDNSDELYDKHHIEYYETFEEVFINLIHVAEKRLGLTKREYKDKIIIYPKNATLEKVLDNVAEEVQWELIRYEREDLSLTQKKKSLAFLATQLVMEQNSKETDYRIKELMKETTNILNNLNIRHNNKDGKEKNKLTMEGVTPTKESKLCDYIFNNMLLIMLLREQKKNVGIYAEFSQKQKKLKEMLKADRGE